jgi:hypothetical protein
MELYRKAYEQGRTFATFLERATVNRELWHAMAARPPVPGEAVERIGSLPGPWRLLALADDWCGDAVNILPVVAGLANGTENLELRIAGRDEHSGLIERHLTRGSRSIPVFILLDASDRPRGWWGPRPVELQAWFEAAGRALSKEDRYRELRRWYARDRGATIAREIADLVACAAAGDEPGYNGTVPCSSLRAA